MACCAEPAPGEGALVGVVRGTRDSPALAATSVARYWTYPCRRPGRCPIGEGLVTLIVAMAADNPTWGYQRTRGELFGLRRRVFFAGITTNPTWAWVTQVARNVTAYLCDAGIDVEFLLADRDAKFAPGFDALWHGVGARILRGPLRGPQRERDRRALGANGPIGVRRPSRHRERTPSPPGARLLRAPLQPAPAAPGPRDGRAGPSWKCGVVDASEDHTHPPARGTRRADQRVSRRTSCSDKFSDPTRSIRRIAVGASSRSPLRAVDS